eukprot:scaffold39136_cov209-Skeletonema_marinoi.AAC.10
MRSAKINMTTAHCQLSNKSFRYPRGVHYCQSGPLRRGYGYDRPARGYVNDGNKHLSSNDPCKWNNHNHNPPPQLNDCHHLEQRKWHPLLLLRCPCHSIIQIQQQQRCQEGTDAVYDSDAAAASVYEYDNDRWCISAIIQSQDLISCRLRLRELEVRLLVNTLLDTTESGLQGRYQGPDGLGKSWQHRVPRTRTAHSS